MIAGGEDGAIVEEGGSLGACTRAVARVAAQALAVEGADLKANLERRRWMDRAAGLAVGMAAGDLPERDGMLIAQSLQLLLDEVEDRLTARETTCDCAGCNFGGHVEARRVRALVNRIKRRAARLLLVITEVPR